LSESHKQAISKSKIGKKRAPFTAEHRRNISLANRRRKKIDESADMGNMTDLELRNSISAAIDRDEAEHRNNFVHATIHFDDTKGVE
jgi:hypothetical protein